jgi:hypothetical protein
VRKPRRSFLGFFRKEWSPEAGIHILAGENGSGKTMVAFERCVLPVLDAGFPVVSNITVKTEVLGYPRDEFFVPLESWRDLLRLGTSPRSITRGRPCVVLIDEGTKALPARSYQDTPPELVAELDMFRHNDSLVALTVPNFLKVEKSLRGVTQLVTLCQGRVRDPWERDSELRIRRDEGGRRVARYGKHLWPSHLVFETADFYPELIERQLAGSMPWEPLKTERWKLLKMWAPLCVDTKERVRLLDHINPNVCSDCGLPLRRQYCSGDHSPAPERPRRRSVA